MLERGPANKKPFGSIGEKKRGLFNHNDCFSEMFFLFSLTDMRLKCIINHYDVNKLKKYFS